MRKNTIASLVMAVSLGLTMAACEDAKARQENEQLKAHVAEIEKQNTDLSGQVDALTTQNAALKTENEQLKARHAPAKKKKAKHGRDKQQ